ncbi:hypothetical protein [Nocardioides gilvus]|uniref:hypothetical protein n=1 Tax=Nocardioides gilvus TaxID=1735589 RepID=UPI000D74C774|nr:hypothetical protein [Nocardioides gilvus]
MTLVDIETADLTWFDLLPAGSSRATRMSMLWKDEERGLRSVLVDFPDDWRRETTGHQPAQEEMVALSGAMHINGLRAGVGQLLVGVPHATRADTWNEPTTRVLVWFSGEGGGWQEGPHDPPFDMQVVDLEPGVVREPREGLNGSIEVHEEIAGRVFDHDADLLWVEALRWTHLPAGTAAPEVAGRAVVKLWG